MKPPADRRLDMQGSGIDLPAPARPRYGLRWPLIVLVATILGAVSSLLAWQFTRALGKPTTPWQSLVIRPAHRGRISSAAFPASP